MYPWSAKSEIWAIWSDQMTEVEQCIEGIDGAGALSHQGDMGDAQVSKQCRDNLEPNLDPRVSFDGSSIS